MRELGFMGLQTVYKEEGGDGNRRRAQMLLKWALGFGLWALSLGGLFVCNKILFYPKCLVGP